MERCKECKHWKQRMSRDFGECWSGKIVCCEDMLCDTSAEGKHIICDGHMLETNKDFGCIDFKSKSWSLK